MGWQFRRIREPKSADAQLIPAEEYQELKKVP